MAKCKECLHFDVCKRFGNVVDFDVDDGVCLHYEKQLVRCKDCIHAKPVMHRGEPLEDIFKCTYLKPNTNMFDIDYCRYGKRRK